MAEGLSFHYSMWIGPLPYIEPFVRTPLSNLSLRCLPFFLGACLTRHFQSQCFQLFHQKEKEQIWHFSVFAMGFNNQNYYTKCPQTETECRFGFMLLYHFLFPFVLKERSTNRWGTDFQGLPLIYGTIPHKSFGSIDDSYGASVAQLPNPPVHFTVLYASYQPRSKPVQHTRLVEQLRKNDCMYLTTSSWMLSLLLVSHNRCDSMKGQSVPSKMTDEWAQKLPSTTDPTFFVTTLICTPPKVLQITPFNCTNGAELGLQKFFSWQYAGSNSCFWEYNMYWKTCENLWLQQKKSLCLQFWKCVFTLMCQYLDSQLSASSNMTKHILLVATIITKKWNWYPDDLNQIQPAKVCAQYDGIWNE